MTYEIWGDYEASKASLAMFMIPDMAEGGDFGGVDDVAMEQTDQYELSVLVGGDDDTDLRVGSGAVCGGESFAAGTRVLLASGARVAISRVRAGVKVLAVNVRTGRARAESVTAVLVHFDIDRYDLTVRTSHATAVIHTTSSHLFWAPYLNQWVTANKLSRGEHLKTPNGATVTVVGGTTPKVHDGWMWDLTVPGNNDHDFYVLAVPASGDAHVRGAITESTPVLVHNDSCPTGRALWQLTKDGSSAMKQGGPFKTTFYQSASDGTWWTPDVAGHGGSAFKEGYSERGQNGHGNPAFHQVSVGAA